MGTIHDHQPNLSDQLNFQSSIMNLIENEQTHVHLPPTVNDHFMERLAQMETELGAELSTRDANIPSCNLPNQQESQGNEIVLSIEDGNHFESLFGLLLRGARAVEASNWSLAANVIAKLKCSLSLSNQENDQGNNDPFINIVFYFTQALLSRSGNPLDLLFHGLVPLRTIMLLEASPYIRFAQFTANQAILETIQGENGVHVIDLDIMEGTQWPPLMVDLASSNGVSMRITAIIAASDDSAFIQLTSRRLTVFADSIGLPFEFDSMLMEKEEDFDRPDQVAAADHMVVANCVTHQLHRPNKDFSTVKTFLNGVTRLPLEMLVLVEEELFNFTRIPSMSFSEFFSEVFRHYLALSDSLVHGLSGKELDVIEKEIMGLRILDSVRKFPTGMGDKMKWKDGFSPLKDLEPVPMSASNVSQGKLLVGLFGRGYWVQHESCRLSLCWKSRPLKTVSVWVSADE